jgi:hypothetical protein
MKIYFAFAGLLSVLTLSACASVMEGQQQDITLKTPGETEVICYLDNGTLQYKLYSGDTKVVTKNYKSMQADCYAPGNRRKTFTIPWIVEPWTYGNVANGAVPGVTYDVLSKAIYAYPDIVTVDFSDQAKTAYPAPDYHRYKHPVGETYQPGVHQLPSETGKSAYELKKKDQSELRGQSNPFDDGSGTSSDISDSAPPSRFSGGTRYNPESEDK